MGLSFLVAISLGVGGACGGSSARRPSAAMVTIQPSPPVTFGPVDDAKITALIGQGFSNGEALFITQTTIEGTSIAKDRVRLTDTFPTGNRGVINIQVVPANGTDPKAIKLKTGSSGGNFTFTLEYFVPYTDIPAAAQPVALREMPGGQVMFVAQHASAEAGGTSGVNVIVNGTVDQFKGDAVDKFVEFIGEHTKNANPEKLNGKLKTALVVKDVLDMGAALDKLLTEIDRLEKCAKDPVNPLTQKAYKDKPGEKQRILDLIAGVRAELKGNAVAGVIGTINQAGAGLIKSAPWLGYIVGPGTAWALDNFQQVAQDRMNELRKGISSCEKDLKVNNLGVTGTKCGGPVGAWKLHLVAYGAQSGEGDIAVTLGEDGSGSYAFTGTAHTPYGDAALQSSGAARYTATGDTSGMLNLGVRGTFPVTGGMFCKDGTAVGG